MRAAVYMLIIYLTIKAIVTVVPIILAIFILIAVFGSKL